MLVYGLASALKLLIFSILPFNTLSRLATGACRSFIAVGLTLSELWAYFWRVLRAFKALELRWDPPTAGSSKSPPFMWSCGRWTNLAFAAKGELDFIPPFALLLIRRFAPTVGEVFGETLRRLPGRPVSFNLIYLVSSCKSSCVTETRPAIIWRTTALIYHLLKLDYPLFTKYSDMRLCTMSELRCPFGIRLISKIKSVLYIFPPGFLVDWIDWRMRARSLLETEASFWRTLRFWVIAWASKLFGLDYPRRPFILLFIFVFN